MTHRFLIADHDPHIREGCRRFLTARGFEVDVAADALQCVEQIRSTCPTVLVLDSALLWGGGDGVLDWLCSQEPFGPQTVLLAESHSELQLPIDLPKLISARLERPRSLHDLEQFIDRLEDAAHEYCLMCPAYEPLAVERAYR